MTDKDIEKLLRDFGQTIANDGEAFGIAIALSKADAQNVAVICYANPFELGYMISKAVESIVNSFETEEELAAFSRGMVDTINYINDKRNIRKHLH